MSDSPWREVLPTLKQMMRRIEMNILEYKSILHTMEQFENGLHNDGINMLHNFRQREFSCNTSPKIVLEKDSSTNHLQYK